MSNENISVSYSLVNDWGNVFQGKVEITNNSGSNLDSWDLDFDLSSDITEIWDAEIVDSNNDSYTITHAAWNREIKAGETITFGFIGNGDDTTLENFDIDGSTFNSPSSSDSIYTFSNPDLSSDLSLGETYQGRATFYDAANPTGGKGNSGYDIPYGNLDEVTAINNIQWNGSEASGAFLEVSGPKQRGGAEPIIVQVQDLLYERADGLDLSAEAFAEVANPVDGVVNIEYELIGPSDDFVTPHGYSIGEGVVVESISGANPWYGAVRLNNHRYPIESVDLINEGGGTVALERGSDNRFIIDSSGGSGITTPQDLLVTDIFGQEVVLDDINITSGNSVDIVTGEQFPII